MLITVPLGAHALPLPWLRPLLFSLPRLQVPDSSLVQQCEARRSSLQSVLDDIVSQVRLRVQPRLHACSPLIMYVLQAQLLCESSAATPAGSTTGDDAVALEAYAAHLEEQLREVRRAGTMPRAARLIGAAGRGTAGLSHAIRGQTLATPPARRARVRGG